MENDNDDDSLEFALKRIAESEAVPPEVQEYQNSLAQLEGVPTTITTTTSGNEEDDLAYCLKQIAEAEARQQQEANSVAKLPMAPESFHEEEKMEEAAVHNEVLAAVAAADMEDNLDRKPPAKSKPVPVDKVKEAAALAAALARDRKDEEALKQEKNRAQFLTRPERGVQLGKVGSVPNVMTNTGTAKPGAVSVEQPTAAVETIQRAEEIVPESSQIGHHSHPPTSSTGSGDLSKKNAWLLGGAFALIVVIVVVVVVVVVVNKSNENPTAPTTEVVEESTAPPVKLEDFATQFFPVETQEAIQNGSTGTVTDTTVTTGTTSSPQASAYQWMLGDLVLMNENYYTEAQIRQRFALATFYYATHGQDSWDRKDGWLDYATPECQWFTKLTSNSDVEPVPNPCNEDGYYTDLVLSENKLKGEIPPEIAWLSSLESIKLSFNELQQPFPEQLVTLMNLTEVDMADNQISGTLPTELGLLPNLRGLYMESNNLSGNIPSELANCSDLKYLRLNNNNMNGRIPRDICDIQSLAVDCDSVCGCDCSCS